MLLYCKNNGSFRNRRGERFWLVRNRSYIVSSTTKLGERSQILECSRDTYVSLFPTVVQSEEYFVVNPKAAVKYY